VRHNTYYRADGSDLRDATEEEIEKYRLAASYKRRKPESEPVRDKAKTTNSATRDEKKESAQPTKCDDDRGREKSIRHRDKDAGSRKKEIGDKGGRAESRDSRKDKGGGKRSHSRSKTDWNESGRRSDIRTAKRDEKGSGDVGDVDEDERDQPKMEEIRLWMENRKASKVIKIGGTEVKVKSTPVSGAASSSVKEIRTTTDASKLEEKLPGSRKGAKKTAAPRTVSSEAGISQREEAIRWAASGTASETSMAKGGVESEMTTNTRVIMEVLTVEMGMVTPESADSLFVQEFVALQYPPVEEVVSSTVRLGRALVSGALGMRTDDPKLFKTAMQLPDCSVVIRSTKRKAKAPVSAPPPNSIDSEMDMNDSDDIQLSQSATDVGVQIELPGLGVEAMLPEILAKEKVMISDKPIMTEAPPTD